MKLNGIITKGIGGFYYVESAGRIYECKARGNFRKKGISPIPGDYVVICVPDDGYAFIDEISERKNFLIRPPLANLDRLLIVVSSCAPRPNTLVIDKIILQAEKRGIEPVLIFTKTDMAEPEELPDIYRDAGFETVVVDYENQECIQNIKEIIRGKISALAGNSGVGKSTLINVLMPELEIETADISKKLGRGRHTTREATLYPLKNGGYIADTPGFSSLETKLGELIKKDELAEYFREISNHLGNCKFTSCSHTVEKGCAVLEALSRGEISISRHENYKNIYNELKDIASWEYR